MELYRLSELPSHLHVFFEPVPQLGLERTPEEYVANIVEIFREVRRVLRDDGTLWLNLGDSYWANRSQNGLPYDNKTGKSENHMLRSGGKHISLKPKDLIGIPWMVAFALRADGWFLRSDIIWQKPNCMPESVTDRPTNSHEHIFLLAKSQNYYCDMESIKEPITQSTVLRMNQDIESQQGSSRANGASRTNRPMKTVGGSKAAFGPGGSRSRKGEVENESGMRNKRSVWTVSTAQSTEAHFATFPEKLIEPCVLAGCPVGGRILDPFGGSGTTRKVALENNRECTLIDINPAYVEMQERRTAIIQPKLF